MENNIYTHSVQPEDIDYTGQSSIPALYRKVINAVSMNICKEGYGIDVMASRGLTWVLARCGLEIRRRPEVYSELSIGVWKGKEDAVCHGRNVEIRDDSGAIVGCGVTDWCVLDRKTRKPVISTLESSLESRSVDCGQPRRIRLFGGAKEIGGTVGYSECDFNGHLNNGRYVDWFFNLLPDKIIAHARALRLDLNFKNEIMRGADIWASIKEAGERQIDFCLRQGGNIACLASISI